MPAIKIERPVSDLSSLLHPGAIVLLGTRQANGRPNVMALSWYTLLEGEQPRIACVLRSDRQTFHALARDGECVLNIPSHEQIEQVLACGTLSARDLDKLTALGWSTVPAAQVQVPLVAESSAHIECRVVEQRDMDDCTIFILAPLQVWLDASAEMPDFQPAAGSLLLRNRRDAEQRSHDLRRILGFPVPGSCEASPSPAPFN